LAKKKRRAEAKSCYGFKKFPATHGKSNIDLVPEQLAQPTRDQREEKAWMCP
jgi:hypothetical protein